MEYVSLSFTSLLQDILGEVFDAVLAPVLRDVASILINAAGVLIQEVFSNFLLRTWIILLKVVYFLECIFDIFSGVSPVKVENVSEPITLLEYFFRVEPVQQAFLSITFIAVAISFITTIIAVTRSISDMIWENKTPLSTVLSQGLKAAVSFMLIPITCFFMLQMVTQVTVVINSAMVTQNADTTMSDVLFISAAGMGAKSDAIKEEYSYGQKYEDAEQVKADFDIEKFDYVLAYVSSILVVLLMLCSILQFIQRIIMVLLLFVVSPFFVSYMPLDGGAKFKEWREMFVAQVISAFGPIIAMKIYFLIVPFLVGGGINYGVNSYTEACINLFIVIGGAFAVYKSRLLLISVVNPMAAGSMAESGIIGSFISGRVMGVVSQKLMGAGSSQDKKRCRSGKSGGSSGASQYQTKSQAFTGKPGK